MTRDLWTAVGPLDLLDILLVASLVYGLLVVLRGTRAMQVLGGLLVLAGLYLLSVTLELSTMNWILEKFSFYLVLAVVILFQDDIRRALARVGNPFVGSSSRRLRQSNIQEIARACFRLADQGLGALIAVERVGSLEELMDDAHVIDGELTEELLVSVFQPSSPIHDGAVIVREDRVWLAGAFLPLSSRSGIQAHYGARHRAAIGQTEETDSLVFIVSEERRLVSLAFQGVITPVDSPDELRLKVQEILSLEALDSSASSGFTPPRGTAPVSVPATGAAPPGKAPEAAEGPPGTEP